MSQQPPRSGYYYYFHSTDEELGSSERSRMFPGQGTWVAEVVKHPTIGLHLDYDLRILTLSAPPSSVQTVESA